VFNKDFDPDYAENCPLCRGGHHRFLVPHDAEGNVVVTGLAGVHGRFCGSIQFDADVGGYTFAAGILSDQQHGKWEAGSSGMALAHGGGYLEPGGNRIWGPDWRNGRIRLTDDAGNVLATITERTQLHVREPEFTLSQPTRLWVRLSDAFDATQPYSAVVRYTHPPRQRIVTNSGHTPWLDSRPTAGRG
jgi:hypothetical protein